MALDSKTTGTSSTGRRWFFGTNVTVMVLLAVCILVAIDLIAYRHNVRRDLAGGFSSYRVSERTANIVQKAPANLSITTVYTSDEPETDRKKYLPKLRDFCDELRQVNKSVKVEHLYSGADRAELRNRVQSKYQTAATEYVDAIQLAEDTWKKLTDTLGPQQARVGQLLQADSWLGGFSTLANVATILRKDLESLEETKREVDNLVHGEDIPRYQEANTKIKSANDELKTHIEETQTWMKDMDKLVQALSDPNSDFSKTTRDKVEEIKTRIGILKGIAGDSSDPNVPENTTAVMKSFAKAASQIGEWLAGEQARVLAFVKENPAISNLPDWQIRRQIFVVNLPTLLKETAESLTGNSQQLRRILEQPNVPKDQLQNIVRQLRNAVAQYEKNLVLWSNRVLKVLDDASRIDSASKAFLAASASGEAFGEVLAELEAVSKKIDDLPELKLDEIAERLKQDNIVVVEGDDDVRVVTFDEVWPYADPMGAQSLMGRQDESHRRIFDGDTAIFNAVLGMQHEKPFATVIFVGYETRPSQQMRQFQRPNVGPVPLGQIETLKARFTAANFVVKQWDLGGEGDEAKKPEPEEGTKPIYIFLPPAKPAPQNPFMRQPPQKSFGPKELEQVKKVLGEESRAIFLAISDPVIPNPFSKPTPYAYQEMLRDEWGVDVETDYWVMRGVMDRRDPSRFGISLVQMMYMPLATFTEQPIGEPLKARRVLMRQVCPVLPADSLPEGVKVDPILTVPETSHDMWAEKDILRIATVLREGRQDSTFTIAPDAMRPPFPVMVAVENETQKSKIVVAGNGLCYSDGYLAQRVMRFEGEGARVVTDPPPTENADLLMNMLYWLSDRPELIASGPAPVPVIGTIDVASRRSLWMVTVGWAFIVLIAGGVVMHVRRK